MIEDTLKSLIGLPNTYIGEAPIDVDNCQWIKASSGSVDIHFSGDTCDHPLYAIYVRGTNNAEVSMRMQSIYDKLRNYVGANYTILITHLPAYIGRDEKYRAVRSLRIEYQGGY